MISNCDNLENHKDSIYWLKLLEKNPETFLTNLQELYDTNPQEAKLLVNSSNYIGWYGNFCHLICHLAGKLENYNDQNQQHFYGSTIFHLDQKLAIKILKLIYLCDCDFNFTDYYGDKPIETMIKAGLTKRNNNELFQKFLEDLTEYNILFN